MTGHTSARPAAHAVGLAPPVIAQRAASATGVSYVHELASGQPGPEVLLTALVHGNEYSGALALDAFLASGLQPRRGRITAAFCNVAAFERFEPARPDASRFVDEDFNRVWSTARLDASGGSSELARARELRPVVERATHLLDLHSMHEPCEPLLVTGLLQRNIDFAQALGLGAQAIVDAGHQDGVRMRDFGRFGEVDAPEIALLLEAGQHWEPASLQTARNALMRFLLACGAVERRDVPEGWLQPDRPAPAPIIVTDRVVATSMDFQFVADYRGGEVIPHAGDIIATDAGKPVRVPYDDCVLVMPSVRQLRPGVTTVRLGRRGQPPA
ncbi:MAG: succinylglutamate desuccinylase [Comamonadaceae bacterium]|nr:MAG: succinylglutamate desuccinylase [Comamonadaceae bacterium]